MQEALSSVAIRHLISKIHSGPVHQLWSFVRKMKALNGMNPQNKKTIPVVLVDTGVHKMDIAFHVKNTTFQMQMDQKGVNYQIVSLP